MCTVTYIPKISGEGYYFTHNRDESIRRKIAVPPVIRQVGDKKILCPVDRQGGGTWIAISEDKRLACLLNGGSSPHKRKDAYRHSRGLVVLDFFSFSDSNDFIRNYDMKELEPFTLLLLDGKEFYQLVWENARLTVNELNPAIPYLFSSYMLYSQDIILTRRKWFHDFIRSTADAGPEEIIRFHRYAGSDDPEAALVVTLDNLVHTVSISHLDVNRAEAHFTYIDLINDIRLNKTLEFASASGRVQATLEAPFKQTGL
ncbi:MAG: NRDE family protein [Bacteroidales bacterium]|nr:NRDE family protein [Bacteroidales bacterium]